MSHQQITYISEDQLIKLSVGFRIKAASFSLQKAHQNTTQAVA